MSSAADHDRFEELDAGRVFGDLTAEEASEWTALSRSLGAKPDHGLDLAAAAVAATFATGQEDELPATLADRLQCEVAGQAPSRTATVVRPGIWDRIVGSQAGWAAAALFAALLVATFLTRSTESSAPSFADAKAVLLESAQDVITTDFGGGNAYLGMKGEVVWSDTRQEGYMTLANLPANDPTVNQYQLWIVDPKRDEAPVDGGVFDIPPGSTNVVIPIDAKLAVSDPAAFVITLEQPGGVVKSKQEVVVAVAKS